MIWRISLFLIWLSSPAWAVECADREFDRISFTVCEVGNAATPPRLFLKHSSGTVYGHFGALPGNVTFAMNAGMYHADRAPVGHYIEDGVEAMRVIPNAGSGNFGMLPNGVYCIGANTAHVIETKQYLLNQPTCAHATQSGPMLVIDGQLHPRFIRDSTFTNIRNGVGTSDDGQTSFFAISNQRVNFETFARLFRDGLGVNNALYFDGSVSRLYAPMIGRNDFGPRMGPIVAVTD